MPRGLHRPEVERRADYFGAFAVTAGIGIEEHVARFESAHDDYSSIMLKALADRCAEAAAEHFHERVRREFWGYSAVESLTNDALIREEYRGIRPARGTRLSRPHRESEAVATARCRAPHPDPPDRFLRDVSDGGGERLVPRAPGSALLSTRPIARDQVEDYARRKGMSLEQAEKWLAPNLGY